MGKTAADNGATTPLVRGFFHDSQASLGLEAMKIDPQRIFPFLRWFPMTRETIRADLMAGITVALLLVPQSMAYAQLAGLPVVYGLYASIVPVIVASLWGSCNQLHTAPVAMLSMMSAAALIPFATVGSDKFVELAIMLGLMVGVLRFALGMARMGFVVNYISSPVLIGFTNAAALIIGLSQLNKILGVPFPRSDAYLSDLLGVITQIAQTHWPTLAFAVGAYIIIRLTDRFIRIVPGVLVAVVVATAVSAAIGFERKEAVPLDTVQAGAAKELIRKYINTQGLMDQMKKEITSKNATIQKLLENGKDDEETLLRVAELEGEVVAIEHELKVLRDYNNARRIELNQIDFYRVQADDGSVRFHAAETLREGMKTDGRVWRFHSFGDGVLVLSSGGAVVGEIPRGLPEFSVPVIDSQIMLLLLPAAFVMAMIGFLEAMSISKAIALRTKQKVDLNQELVGQGLANIAGSFFNSFTVSGSFSRSALAAKMGAQTGLFAIISAMAVVLTLLFFTPYLYHLPQAVLAVIVMMAVFGLIRVRPLLQAWRIDRVGAIIGIITFAATLLMAPAIANGILVGVVLTLMAFVIRTMRPRSEVLGIDADGILKGIKAHNLKPVSEKFVLRRYDGAIMFANAAYFERVIIDTVARFPKAKTIVIVGGGVNWIDASGEEKIREMTEKLREQGITLGFSSLKQQVQEAFDRSGLTELIGWENIYTSKNGALKALLRKYEGEELADAQARQAADTTGSDGEGGAATAAPGEKEGRGQGGS